MHTYFHCSVKSFFVRCRRTYALNNNLERITKNMNMNEGFDHLKIKANTAISKVSYMK